MPAYIVVMREGPVQDEDEYAEYKRKGRANPVKVPLKPLSVYGAIHPIEGEAPDGVVMLQFVFSATLPVKCGSLVLETA